MARRATKRLREGAVVAVGGGGGGDADGDGLFVGVSNVTCAKDIRGSRLRL